MALSWSTPWTSGTPAWPAWYRADPRVRVRKASICEITLQDLDGQPVDAIVGDVSFISLRLALAAGCPTRGWVALLLVSHSSRWGGDDSEPEGW